MWTLYEPLHIVTYFTPEAREAFEAAGLRGFWRGYFAGRAAPLGPVDAAPVIASFFSFAPGMVVRAIPDVWRRATPEQALQARMAGAVAALHSRLDVADDVVAEIADLLDVAIEGLDCAGRVLAAANVALPRPETDWERVWHATTVLREHRGDGHVAALVAAGVSGCEALVWRASYDLRRDHLQPARGWTDEEWEAARQGLIARGWITADGAATPAGEAHHRAVEDATDRAAAPPWDHLGLARTARLDELLAPLAQICAEPLATLNPIGMPTPSAT
jgi:hypothetical protein